MGIIAVLLTIVASLITYHFGFKRGIGCEMDRALEHGFKKGYAKGNAAGVEWAAYLCNGIARRAGVWRFCQEEYHRAKNDPALAVSIIESERALRESQPGDTP